MIEILIEPFQYEFMTRSIVTAIGSGVMLSLLGPFAINRTMGFMADAMAHATLPIIAIGVFLGCLLYTSPSPRDDVISRMPSSA